MFPVMGNAGFISSTEHSETDTQTARLNDNCCCMLYVWHKYSKEAEEIVLPLTLASILESIAGLECLKVQIGGQQ